MEKVAAVHVLKGDKSKEKILQDMHHAKKMAGVWSKTQRVNKQCKGRGFTSLQIPESWPMEENDFQMQVGLRILRQAQGTLFMVPPLSVQVDWAANSMTSELILEGDYSNEELSGITQLLLHHCKREYNTEIIGKQISKEEWQDKIAVWKEHTTTSHSGRHLGHYKALLGCHAHDPQSDKGK
eukprot:72145-Ditylum_brightwellii.AAC.1